MIDLLRRIVVLGRHMTGIILEFDMLLAMVLVMDVLLVCMVVVRHLVMLWERMIRLLYAVHLPGCLVVQEHCGHTLAVCGATKPLSAW